MSIISSILVYICVWSMVLFMVLPFGTRHGNDPPVTGQDPGAPDRRNMVRPFIQTSLIALVVFMVIYGLIAYGALDLYFSSQEFRP